MARVCASSLFPDFFKGPSFNDSVEMECKSNGPVSGATIGFSMHELFEM